MEARCFELEICCEGVEKVIRKTVVLQDINCRLESGTIYGLWGKNGCGKTMLMRMIGGLVRPTKGTVKINGAVLSQGFPERMGMLIENPAFLDSYTGFGNLKLLAAIRGEVTDAELKETLTRVGLEPGDKRVYRKYSLGMRQRLGIACAIMEKPDLILLDEPINALDTGGVALVRKILEEEKARGALILVSCHDAEEMNALADRIFVMENGRIIGQKENVAKEAAP